VSLAHAIILGIVQGLAEFLPVSSSAHLALVPWLFHWDDPGLAFDVALHVGTLIAVLWYFRAQWVALVRAVLGKGTPEERRRVVFLIIATIPGAIAGLALEKYADSTFRDPRLIATVLIVMGVLLWWVDKSAASDRSLPTMTARDALLVGLAQMFAIVPGVSRSGSTITAGRALRFTREAAAALLKLPHVLRTEGVTAPLAAGVVASAVSGWLAIAVLLRFVVRRSYGVFAAYRIIIGLIVLGIAFSR
jgi:undecaprenyl-diphosphatase